MSRELILLGYTVSALSLASVWLAGRRVPGRIAPAADLLAHMMQTRSTRIGLLVVWWWLGWHYLAWD